MTGDRAVGAERAPYGGAGGHSAAGAEGSADHTSSGGGGGRPEWLDRVAALVPETDPGWFSRFLPTEGGQSRESAVLFLVAPGEGAAAEHGRLVLIERAHTLRSHAGQVAFAGGRAEEHDRDLVGTALREAEEEIGLDPGGVEVITSLPVLHIPVSRYDVTPVLAWWREPTRVWARDRAEVEQVIMPPVSDLLDPANRLRVRHPSGYIGPAFTVEGLLVWGFTAGVIDRTLELAGLTVPWDRSRVKLQHG